MKGTLLPRCIGALCAAILGTACGGTDYDVVIAGGGTGGTAAAIQSA